MKRDIDLVRKILLEVESSGINGLEGISFRLEGYDDEVVARHVQLLDEAGYVAAVFIEPDQGGIILNRINRLTWKGYEFLDAARNDSIWQSVKKTLRTKAGDVPFEVLSSSLVEGVKKLLET